MTTITIGIEQIPMLELHRGGRLVTKYAFYECTEENIEDYAKQHPNTNIKNILTKYNLLNKQDIEVYAKQRPNTNIKNILTKYLLNKQQKKVLLDFLKSCIVVEENVINSMMSDLDRRRYFSESNSTFYQDTYKNCTYRVSVEGLLK